ncbi:MAG: sorbosone dehydrogenase family protein [Gammaproteobacteria bacterium]|nr:MAG: sorbosone dehydrogenase family protein [Gammaproteobacteria bacterium]
MRIVLSLILSLALQSLPAADMPTFKLPPGFQVEELATGLPSARSLAWGERGTLFVGSRRAGRVYAVRDALGAAPRVLTIAEGLDMPNGVAFRDAALYVAEPQRLLRFPGIEARLDSPGEPEVVSELPYRGRLHSWRYIAFGPDGRLYLSLGAPCNVCPVDDETGVIVSLRADGSDRRVEARGVRNSVGFTWHPVTGELWFTDNGRDLLGDERPPCELNRLRERGLDFGFPYCHGGDIPDPEFGDLGNCADAEAPVQKLAPHSAPLGLAFYTGEQFPAEYRGALFIAEHGSWNRSKAAGKTGYRVSVVWLDGNRAVGYEPFMTGFLDGQKTLGRPVDLLLAPDGSLLLSDDHRGVIYRISWRGQAAGGEAR